MLGIPSTEDACNQVLSRNSFSFCCVFVAISGSRVESSQYGGQLDGAYQLEQLMVLSTSTISPGADDSFPPVAA